jgi:hypothetical protein
MKRLFLTCIIAVRIYANDSAEIKTVTRDSPRHDEKGRPLAHEEQIFRGKEKILQTIQMIRDGVIRTTRFFIVNGDTVLIESDEDGTGKFDTLVVYNHAKGGTEVFKRQPDGSVKPVDEKTLTAFKRKDKAMSDFWAHAFDNGVDEKKFRESAKALREELQDAEKQMEGKK